MEDQIDGMTKLMEDQTDGKTKLMEVQTDGGPNWWWTKLWATYLKNRVALTKKY